jgi:hypothetical protein
LLLSDALHEAVPVKEKSHPRAEAMPGMATLPEGPALFFSLAEEMGLSLMQVMTTRGHPTAAKVRIGASYFDFGVSF